MYFRHYARMSEYSKCVIFIFEPCRNTQNEVSLVWKQSSILDVRSLSYYTMSEYATRILLIIKPCGNTQHEFSSLLNPGGMLNARVLHF